MLDVDFLKSLPALGIGGCIAIVIFHFYRKDVRSFTELWRAQTEMLVQVVKENTASNTELKDMVRSLHHRLDRGDIGHDSQRRHGGNG